MFPNLKIETASLGPAFPRPSHDPFLFFDLGAPLTERLRSCGRCLPLLLGGSSSPKTSAFCSRAVSRGMPRRLGVQQRDRLAVGAVVIEAREVRLVVGAGVLFAAAHGALYLVSTQTTPTQTTKSNLTYGDFRMLRGLDLWRCQN